MKFTVKHIYLFVLLSMIFACKVNQEQEVLKVAKNYLNAIDKKDFKLAKKMSTEESYTMIDMLESFSKMDGSDTKKHVYDNFICKIDGDKAECDYRENGEDRTMNLVKVRKKWYVDMKKETPDISESDSINAVEKELEEGPDTTTYFDFVLLEAKNINNGSSLTFWLNNRGGQNLSHLWIDVYISDKNGKLIQKKEVMFNGILKNSMLDNLSNSSDIKERCKITVALDNVLPQDIGEIYLNPVRFDLDPNDISTEDNEDEYSVPVFDRYDVAPHIRIANNSEYNIRITF